MVTLQLLAAVMVPALVQLVVRHQTEVSDLDDALGREVDVGGLEVPVDEALAVDILHPGADLTEHAVHLRLVAAGVEPQPVPQCLLQTQLHHDVHEGLLLHGADRGLILFGFPVPLQSIDTGGALIIFFVITNLVLTLITTGYLHLH